MTVNATSVSPFVAPEDYVPGGGSFRPGGSQAAASALDLRETGTTEVAGGNDFFGADGASFADLIDVINPLQHLPVVGQIYRSITGDTIAPAARLAGGSLYGGFAGLFVAAGSAFLEEAAGDDVERTVASLFGGGDAPATTAPVRVADAAAAEAPLPGAVAGTNAAEVKAALAEGDAARAAMPAQAHAPMAAAGTPQLSPQAFQALMTSIGAVPQQAAPTGSGLTAGADVAPVGNRAAAHELHDTLQGYAQQQGLALPTVRR